jgi:Lectin C-type domain
MRICPLLSRLAVALLFLAAGCDSDHGNYSFIYEGTTYEVVKDRKTWPEAAAYAAKRNAKLAEIKKEGQQFAIYKALVEDACVAPTYTSVADGGGAAYLWIGATDRNKEGEWIWDGANTGKGPGFWTGEGINGKGNGKLTGLYANWGGCSTGKYMEPDNFNNKQNAGAIALQGWPVTTSALGHGGEWNDLDENDKLYFIMEHNH